MEQTECSETSAYKIQTPGNYPEENIQHFLASSFQDNLISNSQKYKQENYFANIVYETLRSRALQACCMHKHTNKNVNFKLKIRLGITFRFVNGQCIKL
jgi:hypothetical protein